MEPHTGLEPGAMEGRVNPERSEPKGRVDADRAPGISGLGSITRGPVTPSQKTTTPETIEENPELPRPISPVTVDGGVNVINRSMGELAPRGRALLAEALAAPKGALVQVPLREAPPGGAWDCWAEVVSATISRGRRAVSLLVEGHVFIKLRPDASTGPEVEVEFKAPGLWRHGWERMSRFWLKELHNLVTGGDCEYEMLEDNGWSVTRVPLCVDFKNLEITLDDTTNWVNVKRTDVWRGEQTRIVGNIEDRRIETLYIGKSSSYAQLVLYDKRAEIASKATGSHVGTYLRTWEAHGYKEGDAVRRVECRLKGDGLRCKDQNGDKFSLRNPAALCDQLLLDRFWSYHTHTRRLHLDDNARVTRCTTDPRWQAVIDGGAGMDPKDRWSRDLEAGDRAIERRQKLAAEAAVRNLLNIEALQTGEDHDEPRWSMERTLRDVLMGRFHPGEDIGHLRWMMEVQFTEARRRYAASLGEAIQVRSDAIDELLGI